MPKNYTDELTKWVHEREEKYGSKRQNIHVVSFLAVQKDIEKALEAGFSKKIIWMHMSEMNKLKCRYETFLSYVKKYIGHVDTSDTKQSTTTQDSKTKPLEAQNKLKGFTFNPVPNIEDLI